MYSYGYGFGCNVCCVYSVPWPQLFSREMLSKGTDPIEKGAVTRCKQMVRWYGIGIVWAPYGMGSVRYGSGTGGKVQIWTVTYRYSTTLPVPLRPLKRISVPNRAGAIAKHWILGSWERIIHTVTFHTFHTCYTLHTLHAFNTLHAWYQRYYVSKYLEAMYVLYVFWDSAQYLCVQGV